MANMQDGAIRNRPNCAPHLVAANGPLHISNAHRTVDQMLHGNVGGAEVSSGATKVDPADQTPGWVRTTRQPWLHSWDAWAAHIYLARA